MDLDHAFSTYLAKNQKLYKTAAEWKQRREIFGESDTFIREFSASEPNSSFTLGHNFFSDLSPEERKQRTGLHNDSQFVYEEELAPGVDVAEMRRMLLGAGPLTDSTTGTVKTFSTENLPDSKDWRTEGAVTPIQD